MRQVRCDVLVIGSGIAGLTYALKAAETADVVLITKKERAASSTNYAQGGIAAVMAPDDSLELHVRDTLVAGAGLCHPSAVQGLVRDGPQRVRELIDWGVGFTQGASGLSLGREGGHSRRRILHAADLTGREIERALLDALEAHRNVQLIEDCIAIDLLSGSDARAAMRRCCGVLALDHRRNELVTFEARVTLLATGGFGQAYRHTTNPEIATGDGVAMAYRLGAAVANLEFVQFHPTALYPASEHAFLISEAVRGEGAILRRMDGSALMSGVHHLGSLAPRDVVARAIDMTLKQRGDPYVLLDVAPIGAEHLRARFPNIVAECEARGIEPGQPLPVVPAAHYACGGVRTNRFGQTSIAGLYAAGEVACTGVHGANRLASNSLLEAVVYSHRAAQQLDAELAGAAPALHDVTVAARTLASDAGWSDLRVRLRELMWEDAGIIRDDERLQRAAEALRVLRAQIETRFLERGVSPEAVETRNLADTASLVVQSALMRRESRGLHYSIDHPYRDNELHLKDTVIRQESI
ncbi:MAG TPA: L-aspartate oxidase [Longimicrobiales bacterium]